MVDLHFGQPAPEGVPGRVSVAAHAGHLHCPVRARQPRGLGGELRSGLGDVRGQFCGPAAGTGLDPVVPGLDAGILGRFHAGARPHQQVAQSVGVAREVCQHVAAAPVRQLRRRASLVVGGLGCGLLEITCHMRRTDAHRFYERIGYQKTSFRVARAIAPRERQGGKAAGRATRRG